MRGEGLVAAVGDFPGDIDKVRATLESQDLGDLDAIDGVGFEANFQLVGAIGQHCGTVDPLEIRAMGRQPLANQTALRDELMLGVEQDEILVLVVMFLVLDQFKVDQISTLGGDGRLQQIGADREGFGGRHGRRPRDGCGGNRGTSLQIGRRRRRSTGCAFGR